jgi:hypothetical protein
MPLTVEQIIAEARHWPPDRLAELVDSLSLELHQGISSDVSAAWKLEARRRLVEIQGGVEQPVDGDEVAAEVRRIVGR